MTTVKETGTTEIRRLLTALQDDITALRRRLSAVEERLGQLELREELWQEPDAAGDEPIQS